PGALRPEPGRSRPNRVEDDGDLVVVCGFPGADHALDDPRIERPDVEYERPGKPRHLPCLLAGVRHHRRPAGTDRDIGAVVDRHVVGDVMDEGVVRPCPGKNDGKGLVVHTVSLVPRTDSPCETVHEYGTGGVINRGSAVKGGESDKRLSIFTVTLLGAPAYLPPPPHA